jgi:hypothetical protein
MDHSRPFGIASASMRDVARDAGRRARDVDCGRREDEDVGVGATKRARDARAGVARRVGARAR